jgi:alginate O-acetyltransferase complex protein AlgI
MLFNSYIFLLVFLPVILALWWGLVRWPGLRLSSLVVGSYLFYGWWHWEYTLLLLVSTVVDYWLGIQMAKRENTRDRGIFLALSVVCNLGMLGYFKYSGFLSESINGLLDTFRLGTPLSVPDILLPAGISFYTFQTLSYSVDIYRGEIKPARSLMAFAAYVSMFPQLIAGPIVRYSDVELQMRNLPQTPEWANISKGIWLFVIGMSQKILIADTVSNATSPCFPIWGRCSFLEAGVRCSAIPYSSILILPAIAIWLSGWGCFLVFIFRRTLIPHTNHPTSRCFGVGGICRCLRFCVTTSTSL